MKRDELVNNIENIFGDVDKFLDIVEDDCVYGYDMIRHEDEIYIFNIYNCQYIHWYKLTHIGRDFSTDIKTDEEIINFLQRLKNTIISQEEEMEKDFEEVINRIEEDTNYAKKFNN